MKILEKKRTDRRQRSSLPVCFLCDLCSFFPYTPEIVLMNLKELKEIIDIVTSRESIEELELEKSGVRLRIRRASNQSGPVVLAGAATAAAELPPVAATVPSAAVGQAVEGELFFIKSPIVGTFYRSPGPNSDPFVSTGDIVDKGSVVCIIEAMKLMNEIESDVAGEVVSILVENGQPVEYGEKLFAIRQRQIDV
jgi:oxaloacetate decarboxylase (Na+ extruding) subunit alpha